MPTDAVRRFLKRHATSSRQVVLDDAAPYLLLTADQRAVILDEACRLAAQALLASPWRDRTLRQRDPAHPGWKALIEKHRS